MLPFSKRRPWNALSNFATGVIILIAGLLLGLNYLLCGRPIVVLIVVATLFLTIILYEPCNLSGRLSLSLAFLFSILASCLFWSVPCHVYVINGTVIPENAFSFAIPGWDKIGRIERTDQFSGDYLALTRDAERITAHVSASNMRLVTTSDKFESLLYQSNTRQGDINQAVKQDLREGVKRMYEDHTADHSLDETVPVIWEFSLSSLHPQTLITPLGLEWTGTIIVSNIRLRD